MRIFHGERPSDHKQLIITREPKAEGKELITIYVEVKQDLATSDMAELATFTCLEMKNGQVPSAPPTQAKSKDDLARGL